ncbi:hypothetical protein BCR37DRAFT_391898 [Protomyces lactucae-debilis]|uniref:Alcohol dehydrogenase-like C-terminal domain-containing protein n=1 Tax=Protomyces lactucae-debilis TaxID=2754530 RepID=A0A1Y2FK19_PROLT|nr:uncharacterized protein BCR37DRAFT_391898 [Protomyces lactucae-debilis]ORY84308.1 hypothetical protein BCR37DRAFT_391898 [Protomyces lactucae-debilis]
MSSTAQLPSEVTIRRVRYTNQSSNRNATTIVRERVPTPGPGQVLVAVHAVCLDASSIHPVLSRSFSGTVVFAPPAALADDTTQTITWHAGDRVWGRVGRASDAVAEIIAVPRYALRKMKTDRTFAEASTLAGPGLLAFRALQMADLAKEGRPRVLVHGGNTGIGTFVIQFAKIMQCDVEVTIRPSEIEFKQNCRDLGADDFVDLQEEISYGKTLASFRGRWERNFSAVIDCVGNETSLYDKMSQYTREGSKYLTIKSQSISWKSAIFKKLSVSPREYVYLDDSLTEQEAQKQLELIVRCIDSPEFVDIEVQDVFSLEETDEAIAKKLANSGFGCIVIEVMPANDGTLQTWLKQYQDWATTWVAGAFAEPEQAPATKSRRMSTQSLRKSTSSHKSDGRYRGYDAGVSAFTLGASTGAHAPSHGHGHWGGGGDGGGSSFGGGGGDGGGGSGGGGGGGC